jgi:hypothetical protein
MNSLILKIAASCLLLQITVCASQEKEPQEKLTIGQPALKSILRTTAPSTESSTMAEPKLDSKKTPHRGDYLNESIDKILFCGPLTFNKCVTQHYKDVEKALGISLKPRKAKLKEFQQKQQQEERERRRKEQLNLEESKEFFAHYQALDENDTDEEEIK